MITTNKMNLPQSFVNFVSTARHNEPGTLSATTLLKGDKEIILSDRHFDEMTQDASELVWASFGTAFHLLMEKQDDDSFKEEKFEVDVDGWKVTGRVDRYDMENEVLEDWKTASVWKVMFQSFDDWKAQGLTYAWLMRQSGLNVKRCRFVAMLKDHSKTDAKRKADYPQAPVYIYDFPVTDKDLEETEQRIKAKIKSITDNYKLDDNLIMPCSKSERWADGEEYAVMKTGRKTAVKVFKEKDDPDAKKHAESYAEELGTSHYVEYRPAISRKCADYCPCKEFCNFYHDSVENQQ